MDTLEQITTVREGLKAQLEEGTAWNIVSCDWLRRFKEHVNFDNQALQEGQHPGEISNSELVEREKHDSVASNVAQLRRDCVEGLDFFTLPNEHYKLLKAVYGSDIDVEREVIMVGKSSTSPGVAQIELNPIRVNVFVVKSEDDGTDEELNYLPPQECFHFSRQFSLTSAVQHILDKLALDPPPPYCEDSTPSSTDNPISSTLPTSRTRFWAKTSTTAVGTSQENTDDFSSYRSCPVIPIAYVKEKTDFAGDYLFLRGLESTMMSSKQSSDFDDMVLENAVDMNGKTLDLVIEVASVSAEVDTPHQLTWPRDKQLFQWINKLVPGDLIGASDEYQCWFEAVVLEVLPDSMSVHFKGWAKKFDERIDKYEYIDRLAPLYTKTENWREKLQKGSEIDFTKKVEAKGSKWLPGIVTDVDCAFDTVSIKYRQHDSNLVHQVNHIDLDSEQICPQRTHVKDKKEDWDFHNELPVNSATKPVSTTATVTAGAMKAPYQYSNYYSSRGSVGHQSGAPVVSGAVGLANLGNTCFMNSTLQCLSNTPGLTRLFREDRHVDQVNYDNVLGHKGELANCYGKLIKDMWSDQYSSLRPEEFKRNIGEFAPQFSGYQQHDSSELMMFLLDGLHEDMNRVLQKPSVEKIESKGRDDQLISSESWRRYLLRNDSELVDLCFGQLKSHVTCVGCGYESVTFDEYSSLSLPLPIKTTQAYSLLVYPLPLGSRPFKVTIDAKKDSSVEELCALVSATPLFKKAVESRHHSELGKRKKENDSSYLLVDSDTLDTEKQMDVDGSQLVASIKDSHSHSCSDIQTLEDISIETDQEESAVLVNNSLSSSSSHEKKPPACFHICSLSSTGGDNSRIVKTYEPKSTLHNASATVFAAYEMPCEVSTNNYSYTSYSSSYYPSTAKPVNKTASSYCYVDVVIGVEKPSVRNTSAYGYGSMNPTYSGGGHSRILGFKTAGHPLRIAYEKDVTTREEMNTIIFEAVKVAYDLPNAYSPTRLPYTIHTTSTYATASKGVQTLLDDRSKDAFTLFSYDCLVCCWNAEALGGDDVSSESSGPEGTIAPDGVSVSAVDIEEEVLVIPNVDPEMVSRWLEDGINGTEGGGTKAAGGGGVNQSKTDGMHVMQCFDKFIEREQMPVEETWYCPQCKQHLAPIKKFDIWSAPEILVVHLKRFHYCSRASFTFRDKVNDLIDFPIEGLDLGEYVKSSQSANESTPAVYDLYGVSEHSGTMGGGHYTAKCRNEVDGKWYSFNDSFVRECAPESAISPEAYVLFYKRRHGHLKWGGLIPSAVPLEN